MIFSSTFNLAGQVSDHLLRPRWLVNVLELVRVAIHRCSSFHLILTPKIRNTVQVGVRVIGFSNVLHSVFFFTGSRLSSRAPFFLISSRPPQ